MVANGCRATQVQKGVKAFLDLCMTPRFLHVHKVVREDVRRNVTSLTEEDVRNYFVGEAEEVVAEKISLMKTAKETYQTRKERMLRVIDSNVTSPMLSTYQHWIIDPIDRKLVNYNFVENLFICTKFTYYCTCFHATCFHSFISEYVMITHDGYHLKCTDACFAGVKRSNTTCMSSVVHKTRLILRRIRGNNRTKIRDIYYTEPSFVKDNAVELVVEKWLPKKGKVSGTNEITLNDDVNGEECVGAEERSSRKRSLGKDNGNVCGDGVVDVSESSGVNLELLHNLAPAPMYVTQSYGNPDDGARSDYIYD